jgi:hypothetical protein
VINKKTILIIFTLFLGFFLRLYQFNSPVADWHSHRQADTASVTKNFLNLGINIFKPTYHDLSSHQSGQDNPLGLRMVELPIYNFLSFITIKTTRLPVDQASRLTSIILSLGSALIIFLLIKNITHQFWPAYFSLFFFLFLPFNIFFNRTILPENTAVFFMLLALLAFPKFWLVSALSLALSILVKPFTAIIIGPQLIYLFFKNKNKNYFTLILFLILSFVPLLLWRHWITNFPQGIPASAWLLNFSDKRIFPEWFKGWHIDFLNQIIVLRPYWWRWLIQERISILIFGSLSTILAFFGLLYRKNNVNLFIGLGLVGVFLYFLIVPGGNIQHEYYQILIIPFLAFCLGCGSYYLLNFTFPNKFISFLSLLIITGLSIFFSSEKVLPNYHINRPEIIEAGKKVDLLTPKNSLIIAPYLGDTAFLYQTNRSGFPIEIYDFEHLKKLYPQNPLYLVSVNFDQYTNDVSKKYKTLYKNDQFIILDLN